MLCLNCRLSFDGNEKQCPECGSELVDISSFASYSPSKKSSPNNDDLLEWDASDGNAPTPEQNIIKLISGLDDPEMNYFGYGSAFSNQKVISEIDTNKETKSIESFYLTGGKKSVKGVENYYINVGEKFSFIPDFPCDKEGSVGKGFVYNKMYYLLIFNNDNVTLRRMERKGSSTEFVISFPLTESRQYWSMYSNVQIHKKTGVILIELPQLICAFLPDDPESGKKAVGVCVTKHEGENCFSAKAFFTNNTFILMGVNSLKICSCELDVISEFDSDYNELYSLDDFYLVRGSEHLLILDSKFRKKLILDDSYDAGSIFHYKIKLYDVNAGYALNNDCKAYFAVYDRTFNEIAYYDTKEWNRYQKCICETDSCYFFEPHFAEHSRFMIMVLDKSGNNTLLYGPWKIKERTEWEETFFSGNRFLVHFADCDNKDNWIWCENNNTINLRDMDVFKKAEETCRNYIYNEMYTNYPADLKLNDDGSISEDSIYFSLEFDKKTHRFFYVIKYYLPDFHGMSDRSTVFKCFLIAEDGNVYYNKSYRGHHSDFSEYPDISECEQIRWSKAPEIDRDISGFEDTARKVYEYQKYNLMLNDMSSGTSFYHSDVSFSDKNIICVYEKNDDVFDAAFKFGSEKSLNWLNCSRIRYKIKDDLIMAYRQEDPYFSEPKEIKLADTMKKLKERFYLADRSSEMLRNTFNGKLEGVLNYCKFHGQDYKTIDGLIDCTYLIAAFILPKGLYCKYPVMDKNNNSVPDSDIKGLMLVMNNFPDFYSNVVLQILFDSPVIKYCLISEELEEKLSEYYENRADDISDAEIKELCEKIREELLEETWRDWFLRNKNNFKQLT